MVDASSLPLPGSRGTPKGSLQESLRQQAGVPTSETQARGGPWRFNFGQNADLRVVGEWLGLDAGEWRVNGN